MNRTELVGRVTKDIELKTTQTGTSIVRFSLAVPRRKKDDGADFINCVAYAKIAELMSQYVKKGDRIGVTGRIQTGSYERNGSKIYTTDVVTDGVEFLMERTKTDEVAPIEVTEDLPF